MKFKKILIIFLLFIIQSSIISSSNIKYHFCDEKNNSIPQYESIYDNLVKYFHDEVPSKITVVYISGNISKFDTRTDTILISNLAVKCRSIGTVAHESSHLCMAKLTNGTSLREEFRFFDEGFASIFQSILQNKLEDYKRESLRIAAVQNNYNNVSFEKVQKWHHYFGDPLVKTNFYAYPVGASFVFYIIDSFGITKFFNFCKNIAITNNLDKSCKNVFQKNAMAIETEWREYLKKIKVSYCKPKIIRLVPANESTNVDIKMKEITVEFNVPMNKKIVFISNSYGVSYKNAYWKTDKILAVKVSLLPNYHYKIYLGHPRFGNFVSKEGIELPITFWSFKTDTK